VSSSNRSAASKSSASSARAGRHWPPSSAPPSTLCSSTSTCRTPRAWPCARQCVARASRAIHRRDVNTRPRRRPHGGVAGRRAVPGETLHVSVAAREARALRRLPRDRLDRVEAARATRGRQVADDAARIDHTAPEGLQRGDAAGGDRHPPDNERGPLRRTGWRTGRRRPGDRPPLPRVPRRAQPGRRTLSYGGPGRPEQRYRWLDTDAR